MIATLPPNPALARNVNKQNVCGMLKRMAHCPEVSKVKKRAVLGDITNSSALSLNHTGKIEVSIIRSRVIEMSW